MRVLLGAAGTAGHVNPMLATANILKKKGVDVMVLGTDIGIEKELVPNAGFKLFTIKKLVFPRHNIFKMLFLPFKLFGLIKAVCKILKQEKIDLVCGFGGYVCAPLYLGARFMNIPIVVHEQNACAGIANKMGAKFAKVVALTFKTNLSASKGKTVITGMPLRENIINLKKSMENNYSSLRENALRHFNLSCEKKTLLITGGSLGANSINTAFLKSMKNLPDGIQVIHLSGKGKNLILDEEVKKNNLSDRWKVFEYLEDIYLAYACADFVVCRSGAATVCEISAIGIPACYIPLPIGNGEQKYNAAECVEKGSAILIEDKQFTPKMVDEIYSIILDKARLEKMKKANNSAIVDGASKLADQILQQV